MEAKILLQEGNNLKIKFDITYVKENRFLKLNSKKYLCGAVYFELKADVARCCASGESYPEYNTIISIRFTKLFKNDNLAYICKFSSDDLENTKHVLIQSDKWDQIFIHKQATSSNSPTTSTVTFITTFHADVCFFTSLFAPLYDDDSTDFKLCGEDGSVEVHKLVLKAASPVLRGMLNGKWKETSEGQITIAEVSKETLEQFKQYVYLNSLPTTGIEQLLLLGSYFMMPNLVQACLVKLINKLDDNNVMELTEFAIKFKVTNLFVVIMRNIRDGIVSIDHLAEDDLVDMCKGTNTILDIKK